MHLENPKRASFSNIYTVDQGLVKTIPALRASECLIQCKQENFELAMIGGLDQHLQTKDKIFECTCMQRDFYKFTMQDFSLKCTDVSFKCNILIGNTL